MDILDDACLKACSEYLNQLDDQAKILPCQHAFSSKHIEAIVSADKNNQLICPECHLLVDQSVEELPTKASVMQMLHTIKSADGKTHINPSDLTLPALVIKPSGMIPKPRQKVDNSTKLKNVIASDPNECKNDWQKVRSEKRKKNTSRRKTIPQTDCETLIASKKDVDQRTTVSPEKPAHICSLCGKMFTAQWNLRYHHMSVHLGVVPYSCEKCDKAYATKFRLARHMVIHLDAMPFICTECDKTYTTKADLTRHCRSHLGVKPFVCSDCPMAFTRKDRLVRHQRIHLKIRPFPCAKCTKAFDRKANLVRHMVKSPLCRELDKADGFSGVVS